MDDMDQQLRADLHGVAPDEDIGDELEDELYTKRQLSLLANPLAIVFDAMTPRFQRTEVSRLSVRQRHIITLGRILAIYVMLSAPLLVIFGFLVLPDIADRVMILVGLAVFFGPVVALNRRGRVTLAAICVISVYLVLVTVSTQIDVLQNRGFSWLDVNAFDGYLLALALGAVVLPLRWSWLLLALVLLLMVGFVVLEPYTTELVTLSVQRLQVPADGAGLVVGVVFRSATAAFVLFVLGCAINYAILLGLRDFAQQSSLAQRRARLERVVRQAHAQVLKQSNLAPLEIEVHADDPAFPILALVNQVLVRVARERRQVEQTRRMADAAMAEINRLGDYFDQLVDRSLALRASPEDSVTIAQMLTLPTAFSSVYPPLDIVLLRLRKWLDWYSHRVMYEQDMIVSYLVEMVPRVPDQSDMSGIAVPRLPVGGGELDVLARTANLVALRHACWEACWHESQRNSS